MRLKGEPTQERPGRSPEGLAHGARSVIASGTCKQLGPWCVGSWKPGVLGEALSGARMGRGEAGTGWREREVEVHTPGGYIHGKEAPGQTVKLEPPDL